MHDFVDLRCELAANLGDHQIDQSARDFLRTLRPGELLVESLKSRFRYCIAVI